VGKFFRKLMWRDDLDMISGFGFAVCVASGMLILISCVALPSVFCQYKTAQYESQLYNGKFGTNYSISQFFWAGSTIKDYLNKGEQKTFNVNGLK